MDVTAKEAGEHSYSNRSGMPRRSDPDALLKTSSSKNKKNKKKPHIRSSRCLKSGGSHLFTLTLSWWILNATAEESLSKDFFLKFQKRLKGDLQKYNIYIYKKKCFM